VEKIDTHKGVIVKALLDSSVTGVFINKRLAAKQGFKLQKLGRLLVVKNIDGTYNSGGVITYQIEVNVYYKNYIKRMRIDVCNLGKMNIILGMPWLQAHNLEINWETEEVKMTRCPLLCDRGNQRKEKEKTKRGKRVATLEEKKIVR